jgi:hypothetical protein
MTAVSNWTREKHLAASGEIIFTRRIAASARLQRNRCRRYRLPPAQPAEQAAR